MQSVRIKRELREVCSIGKPKRLVEGMPWTASNNAASHQDVNNFLRRQIERGLKVKS